MGFRGGGISKEFWVPFAKHVPRGGGGGGGAMHACLRPGLCVYLDAMVHVGVHTCVRGWRP